MMNPNLMVVYMVLFKFKLSIRHFLEVKIFILSSNINTVILVTIWALR